MNTPTTASRPTRRSLLSQATSTSSPLGSPALSTPSRRSQPSAPSSLSRGAATVPFDMAANQRAAKRAFETPTKARSSLGPAKSPRFIRKKPLLDRLIDMPSELLERIEPNFDIDSWARPLGFALMVVHVLLRAPLLVHADASTPKSSLLRSETKAKSRWAGRWDANGGQSRSLITWAVLGSVILVMLATVNALYLFRRTRTYRLHLREDTLSSPNARFVHADDPFTQPPTGPPTLKAMGNWIRRHLSPIPVLRFLLNLQPQSEQSGKKRRLVQQLDVWDPPAFNIQLFSAYNPCTALVLHFLAPNSPFIALLVALAVSFQSHFLIGKYTELTKDREILAGEVMHEYDQKFVYPSLFKQRKDASTTTNEAELVW